MNTQSTEGDHHDHHEHEHEEPFSVRHFIIVNSATLIAYLCAIRFITPVLWQQQMQASLGKWILTFLGWHFLYGMFEGPFHRYVLHSDFLWFGHLHTQHSEHHRLTSMGINAQGNVHNKYPIEEPHQHKASYFPWFSYAAFIMISWLVVVPLQHLMPTWPICLGSVFALLFSLSLYEIAHMLLHLPRETFWDPKLEHENRWIKKFWTLVYTPHLRHHDDIQTNENISGFFLIPVWDISVRSYARWKKAYAHGEKVSVEEFKAGKPTRGLFLKILDWGHQRKQVRQRLHDDEVKARNKKKLDKAILAEKRFAAKVADNAEKQLLDNRRH